MSERYFCGLCGDEIFNRDRHSISVHPGTLIPCHDSCLEKKHAIRRGRALIEVTADMDRVLRKHEPEAKVTRCSCGNIAMAIVKNDARNWNYVRCLACGTNVILDLRCSSLVESEAQSETKGNSQQ